MNINMHDIYRCYWFKFAYRLQESSWRTVSSTSAYSVFNVAKGVAYE